MKFTACIKKITMPDEHSFIVVSARGKFLFTEDKTEVNNLTTADKETLFDVKFTKKTPVVIPDVSAVYTIELPDDAEAWKDTREGVKFPTIWVTSPRGVIFTKKCDYKK